MSKQSKKKREQGMKAIVAEVSKSLGISADTVRIVVKPAKKKERGRHV